MEILFEETENIKYLFLRFDIQEGMILGDKKLRNKAINIIKKYK